MGTESHIDAYRADKKKSQAAKAAKKPPQRTQVKKDDKLISALVEVDKESRVLSMLRNGRSIHDTANELGIGTTAVRAIVSKVLEGYHQSIADHAEYVYDVNYLRLENVFGKSMQIAFEDSGLSAPPVGDAIKWAQLAVAVLKEQNRMSEMQLKYRGPQNKDDKNDPAKGNVNIYAPTIVAGDDMYKMAQSSLGDSFMEQHGHRLGPQGEGDLTADDLLSMQLNAPDHIDVVSPAPSPVESEAVLPGVSKMEDKIESLEKKLGVSDADDQ